MKFSIMTSHGLISKYGDVKEPVPINAPEPRGKVVDLQAFVNSDHAGKKTTRRSCTGYLIYLKNSLITWLVRGSRLQNAQSLVLSLLQ